MTSRPLVEVLLSGWTASSIATAVRRLSVADGGPADETALAGELLRWLRKAVEKDGDALARELENFRPDEPHRRAWERLLTFGEPLDAALSDLFELTDDVTDRLCRLLDGPSGTYWNDFPDAKRRAVLALVAIGTRESMGYLLRNISTLCGGDERLGSQLIARQDAFVRLACEMWKDFSWGKRATLLLIFDEQGLSGTPLLELVLAEDARLIEQLGGNDRRNYLDALDFCEPFVTDRQVLVDSLAPFVRRGSEAARKFVTDLVSKRGPSHARSRQGLVDGTARSFRVRRPRLIRRQIAVKLATWRRVLRFASRPTASQRHPSPRSRGVAASQRRERVRRLARNQRRDG